MTSVRNACGARDCSSHLHVLIKRLLFGISSGPCLKSHKPSRQSAVTTPAAQPWNGAMGDGTCGAVDDEEEATAFYFAGDKTVSTNRRPKRVCDLPAGHSGLHHCIERGGVIGPKHRLDWDVQWGRAALERRDG